MPPTFSLWFYNIEDKRNMEPDQCIERNVGENPENVVQLNCILLYTLVSENFHRLVDQPWLTYYPMWHKGHSVTVLIVNTDANLHGSWGTRLLVGTCVLFQAGQMGNLFPSPFFFFFFAARNFDIFMFSSLWFTLLWSHFLCGVSSNLCNVFEPCDMCYQAPHIIVEDPI